MVSETQGKGYDREGWIRKAAGWEHRASVDKQVLQPVYPAMCIHHAMVRVVMHPRRAHEVVRAAEYPRHSAFGCLRRRESANSGRSEFLAENFLGAPDAVQVKLAPAPEHFCPALAEAVQLITEHDPIGRVRRLFDQRTNSE